MGREKFKSILWEDFIVAKLKKNPEEALDCLITAIEEYLKDEDQDAFLLTLKAIKKSKLITEEENQ